MDVLVAGTVDASTRMLTPEHFLVVRDLRRRIEYPHRATWAVTSIVRALGLEKGLYRHLLDNFHSKAIKLDKMTALWTQTVLRLFSRKVEVNGRLVLVGDGIKIAKQGKKMPGVKLLHQSSQANTKPTYIMGHSFQAVSVLVEAGDGVVAVPPCAFMRVSSAPIETNARCSTR